MRLCTAQDDKTITNWNDRNQFFFFFVFFVYFFSLCFINARNAAAYGRTNRTVKSSGLSGVRCFFRFFFRRRYISVFFFFVFYFSVRYLYDLSLFGRHGKFKPVRKPSDSARRVSRDSEIAATGRRVADGHPVVRWKKKKREKNVFIRNAKGRGGRNEKKKMTDKLYTGSLEIITPDSNRFVHAVNDSGRSDDGRRWWRAWARAVLNPLRSADVNY